MATYDQAVRARAEAVRRFSRFGEVVGVGVVRLPDGGFGLKINFREQPRRMPTRIRVGAVPTQIDVVGTIRAYTL